MQIPEEVLSEARAQLPGWVTYGPLVVSPLVSFAVSYLAVLVGQIVALAGTRVEASTHWSERARLAWPATKVSRISTRLVFVSAILLAMGFVGPLTPFPRIVVVSSAAAAILATFFARSWLLRRVRGLSGFEALTTVAVWWFLNSTAYFVLLPTAALIPLQMGWHFVIVFLVAEGLMAWLLFGGGVLAMLRLFGVAKRAAPEIEQMVSQLASGLDHPAPRVWHVRCNIANALAVFFSNELVLVGPLAEILDESELRGILAHEVAHLNEPHRVLWMRAAGVGSFIALAFAIPLIHTYGLSGALGTLPLLLTIVVLPRLTRKMEERADASAVARPSVGGSYASALEKIYRYNLVPAVLSDKWATHPDLYDRMESGGVKPSYSRPNAPPSHLARRGFLASIGTLLASLFLMLIGAHVLAGNGLGSAELDVMLSGGDPSDLQRLAYDRCTQHKDGSGLPLAKAACGLAEENIEFRAFYACLLERCGRDRQAEKEYREAVKMASGRDRVYEGTLIRLNELCRRLGWTEEAEQWLEEARRADSSIGQSSLPYQTLVEWERLYWEPPPLQSSR